MIIRNKDLKVIAQYELAHGASRNVPGAAGFEDFFLKALPKAERSLVERYKSIKNEEIDATVMSIEKESH